jgi:CspA family cold shock protein
MTASGVGSGRRMICAKILAPRIGGDYLGRVDPFGFGVPGMRSSAIAHRFLRANRCPIRRAIARRPLCQLEFPLMATGTVKWFNAQKGYGFIQPETGGADVFVHISAVERAGMDNLREGQRLSYELEQGQRGRVSAVNLRAV